MRAIKCVVVGDKEVGKTSLLKSYMTKYATTEENFPKIYDCYIADVKVDGIRTRLELWDMENEHDYDVGLRRTFCHRRTNVMLFCFSVVNRLSFENVLAKWNPELRAQCQCAHSILVGTKLDLREGRKTRNELMEKASAPITFEEGLSMAEKIGAVTYLECCALTQEGLKTVFDTAVRSSGRPQLTPKEEETMRLVVRREVKRSPALVSKISRDGEMLRKIFSSKNCSSFHCGLPV